MINTSFFENMIEQKLLQLHTCYIAKVISVNGNFANIQPLSLIKGVNAASKQQAVINNTPIIKSALCDVVEGSVVIVACCERDISQTRKGIFALPSIRRHSISDSVVIGVIS